MQGSSLEISKLPASKLLILGEDLLHFLESIGRIASQFHNQAFLVGGAVRDLLLGERSVDIDLMLELDALTFMRKLYEVWPVEFPKCQLPGKPITFKHYHTGKLVFDSEVFAGIRIFDFSTARRDIYRVSGGKPEISLGDLRSDMERRDFTINALAISLAPKQFGELFDIFQAREDLEQAIVRIIHSDSFRDDPARLIRCVRMMVRFGFKMDPATEKCFFEAIEKQYLLRLPLARMFDEFRKAICENCCEELIVRLNSYGLLKQISPELALVGLNLSNIAKLESWEKRFVNLFSEVDEEKFILVMKKFELNQKVCLNLLEIRNGIQNGI